MKIIIDGRDYPMPENFTFREMTRIKKLTGLRAGELYPALAVADTDVAFAFAVTALARAGENVSDETVMDWPIDKVDLDFAEEDDAGPLDSEDDAPEPEEPAGA